MLDNLDTVMLALNGGTSLQQIKTGAWRSEGAGVFRVGDQGHGKNKKGTRLYVYPSESTKKMHLLGIGGKDRREQQADISNCKELAEAIRAAESTEAVAASNNPKNCDKNNAQEQPIPERSGADSGSG